MSLPVVNNPNPYNILVQLSKKNSIKLRIGNRVQNLNKSSKKNKSPISIIHPNPNMNSILSYRFTSNLTLSSQVTSRPISAMTTASINILSITLKSSHKKKTWLLHTKHKTILTIPTSELFKAKSNPTNKSNPTHNSMVLMLTLIKKTNHIIIIKTNNTVIKFPIW